jgi:cardiolipin synthase
MLGAAAGARDRIHLETYILRSDVTGRRFLETLTERARHGVEVRLLYDAFGSLGLDDAALEPLRRAGAEVIAFNPLRRLYPRWAPRRRDHRKIFTVDGRVGFAGGLNIGDEYWGRSGAGWRDTHVRVEGPAVRDLDAVFLESWFRADGPHLAWHELLEPAAEASGEVRCAVVPDGPTYRRRQMREIVEAGLRAATEEVRLASPYFAPGRRIIRALSEAAERGVDVDLVWAGLTDHPILRRAARAFLPRLLPSGVQVFEYQAAIMHAKVALFDRRWAIVGSSNLDRQSFEHSYEVNVVMEGGDVAEQIAAAFDRDLDASERVDTEALARRSFFERLLDRLSALVLRVV